MLSFGPVPVGGSQYTPGMDSGGDDDRYLAALACGTLILAGEVATAAKPAKTAKMQGVIEAKMSEWRALDLDGEPSANLLANLLRSWSDEKRTSLLIDLAFLDPFAPYTLKHSAAARTAALKKLAPAIGKTPDDVDELEKARASAHQAHRASMAKKAGVVGVTTAVVLASAGWLAAPMLGTAIGTAAGLNGAAATAHGLAILGGGSLAAGGFGMAGGMWLVAGSGATLGLVGGSTSRLLFELGAAQAKAELIKLQVSFKINVLGVQHDLAKAQELIKGLTEREAELREKLDEEHLLNDKNAARVTELAEKLEAVVKSRDWMEQEMERNGAA